MAKAKTGSACKAGGLTALPLLFHITIVCRLSHFFSEKQPIDILSGMLHMQHFSVAEQCILG